MKQPVALVAVSLLAGLMVAASLGCGCALSDRAGDPDAAYPLYKPGFVVLTESDPRGWNVTDILDAHGIEWDADITQSDVTITVHHRDLTRARQALDRPSRRVR